MEQTGINQCLVFVGSMENHVADRIEAYAKQNDMKVVETVFKDDRAIDKLTYYIESMIVSVTPTSWGTPA